MTSTPLVSPAVSPLGPNFNMPEYTIPGAYFSPLASPALRPQNEANIDLPELSHSSTIAAEHGDLSKLPDATFDAAPEMSPYEDLSATLSEVPSFASVYPLATKGKDCLGNDRANQTNLDSHQPRKVTRLNPAKWDSIKDATYQIYVIEGKTLPETMQLIGERYHFLAR
jgi:hypothetical protein